MPLHCPPFLSQNSDLKIISIKLSFSVKLIPRLQCGYFFLSVLKMVVNCICEGCWYLYKFFSLPNGIPSFPWQFSSWCSWIFKVNYCICKWWSCFPFSDFYPSFLLCVDVIGNSVVVECALEWPVLLDGKQSHLFPILLRIYNKSGNGILSDAFSASQILGLIIGFFSYRSINMM